MNPQEMKKSQSGEYMRSQIQAKGKHPDALLQPIPETLMYSIGIDDISVYPEVKDSSKWSYLHLLEWHADKCPGSPGKSSRTPSPI